MAESANAVCAWYASGWTDVNESASVLAWQGAVPGLSVQRRAAAVHARNPGRGAAQAGRSTLPRQGDRDARAGDDPAEPGGAHQARGAARQAPALPGLDRQPVALDLRPGPAGQPLRPL